MGWPASPYKGVGYFGAQDIPLFAGREAEVSECAQRLASPNTKILIIHGKSGCGKSSFLRAGLIPALDKHGHGFHFLRHPDQPQKALFVRCTNAPLEQMADEIFRYVTLSQNLKIGYDDEPLDLTPALLDADSREDYRVRAAEPKFLLKSIRAIASRLPRKLVIVIDQAEEVLTLNAPEDSQGNRRRFFRFLDLFFAQPLDAKLIISVRTEFYGAFAEEFAIPAVERDAHDRSVVKPYLLREFIQPQIEAAILRPTIRNEIGEFGAPYDQYGFEYKDDVASEIASALIKADTSGGVLLVMQMVCRSLYENLPEGKTQISIDDFNDLGGVSGRIDAHLTAAIDAAHVLSHRGEAIEDWSERWRLVLCELARRQDDGTVTTKVRSAVEFKDLAGEQGLGESLDDTLTLFASDEWRLLRPVEMFDQTKGANVPSYSLGHDAIGMALLAWKDKLGAAHAKRAAERRARFYFAGAIAAVLLATAAVLGYLQWDRHQQIANVVVRLEEWNEAMPATAARPSLLYAVEGIRNARDLWTNYRELRAVRRLTQVLALSPQTVRRGRAIYLGFGDNVALLESPTGPFKWFNPSTGETGRLPVPPGVLIGADADVDDPDPGADHPIWVVGGMIYYWNGVAWKTKSTTDLVAIARAVGQIVPPNRSLKVQFVQGYVVLQVVVGTQGQTNLIRFRQSAPGAPQPFEFDHAGTIEVGSILTSSDLSVQLRSNDIVTSPTTQLLSFSPLVPAASAATFLAHLSYGDPNNIFAQIAFRFLDTKTRTAEDYNPAITIGADHSTIVLANGSQYAIFSKPASLLSGSRQQLASITLPKLQEIDDTQSPVAHRWYLAAVSDRNIALFDSDSIHLISRGPSARTRRLLMPEPWLKLRRLRFTTDGTKLLAIGGGGLAVWDLKALAVRPSLRTPDAEILATEDSLVTSACDRVKEIAPDNGMLSLNERIPFFGSKQRSTCP